MNGDLHGKQLQRKNKSRVLYLDLSYIYMIWFEIVELLKLVSILKCKTPTQLIDSMLADKIFCVYLNENVSKYKYIQNGLSQGSILYLTYIHITDVISIPSRKFMYTNDAGLVAKVGTSKELEIIINKELTNVYTFFKSWFRTLNQSKSISIDFH
jgi:hypothetical protein